MADEKPDHHEDQQMLEIESTFIVDVNRIPFTLDELEHVDIRQAYLSRPEDVVEIRIRQKGNKYEETRKTPVVEGDFSQFDEDTRVIDEAEFNGLWQTAQGGNLEKTRYFLPLTDNLTVEIDLFRGRLEGLALAEIEFPSAEAMQLFEFPDWFGKDVTQESWVAGKRLAGMSYSDLTDKL